MEKQRKNYQRVIRKKPDFKTELAKIASDISAKIASDTFTKNIEPEFLKSAVLDYPLRNGKRLRPALLIWTCGLFGGNIKKAKLPATAVEIFHNWTLVHDDIIDNDDFRKGLPSTHKIIANFAKTEYNISTQIAEIFGRNNAMLAGDIQHAWAIDLIARSPLSDKCRIDLINRLCSSGGKDLICGECLDIGISYKKWTQTSYDDLLKIAALKTAKLLEFCVYAGAKIAAEDSSVSYTELKKMLQFANLAGVAFQIKDDLLGIFADNTGKPVFSDISEGKPSTVILMALKNSKEREKDFLLSLAGKKQFSKLEIDKVRTIIRNSGADTVCIKDAQKMKDKAVKILLEFRDCDFRNLLIDWTNFVVGRDK